MALSDKYVAFCESGDARESAYILKASHVPVQEASSF